MELNPDKHRQTGRTTRMLQHALALGTEVFVITRGADRMRLVRRLNELQGSERHNVTVMSFDLHLDLEYLIFNTTKNATVLFEHSLLEAELGQVLYYLQNAPGSVQEMVRMANTLVSLGKAPYLIIEGDGEQQYANDFAEPGVFIDTEESLPEYDWLRLRSHTSHPNCVFIPDPVLVKRKWERALTEMSRWNLPKENENG